MRSGAASDTTKYWAAEEDPKLAVENAREHVSRFRDFMKGNRVWRRALRSWRYYHGIFWGKSADDFGDAIKALGQEGELAGLGLNEFRNLIQHLLTLTTQNRPAFDAIAVNSDKKSMDQAELATQLCEYYLTEKRCENFFKTAVEYALVLSAGFIKSTWDPGLGQVVMGDLDAGTLLKEGDLSVSAYSPFHVVHDPQVLHWPDNDWVQIETWRNKWDVAARFPDVADDILATNFFADEYYWRTWIGPSMEQLTDRIPVWEFYHRKTDSMPSGRALIYTGSTKLIDTMETGADIPYEGLPVHRVTSGEMLLTSFGYPVSFDLQGLQEALNAEISTWITNHQHFGVQNIWIPTGANLTVDQILGGLNLIKSDVKPEGLNFAASPPDLPALLNLLSTKGELISGVNSVARGQPEASLKSGTALALIDAKAVQFASGLIQSYHQLLEDVATSWVRILKVFAKTERVISIVGKWNRNKIVNFTSEMLQGVDRVKIQTANPLSKTLAGRTQIAENLVNMGMIRNTQEYIEVMTTGRYEPMLQAETAQLDLVRQENEAIMTGQATHQALPIDHHVMHIREHGALLNSDEIRNQPPGQDGSEAPKDLALAAVMQHAQALMDPAVQELQRTLGWETPMPATPQPSSGGQPPPLPVEGRPEVNVRPPKMPNPAQAQLPSAQGAAA